MAPQTCLKSYGGSFSLGTPQGSQETLTAGLVGPHQTQGLQGTHMGCTGSAVGWRKRGWGAWSPSQGCPWCSVPALSPLSPTRGNRSPQAAPTGAAAVCGRDHSPCHRMSPSHSCASVSLSASDTQGHLPPSTAFWGRARVCNLASALPPHPGVA